MKLILAITCLVFCALGVSSHEIREKRGLSADEQKKLLDVLNKDRQEVGKKIEETMKTLTYDVQLEKEADSLDCETSHGKFVGLQLDRAAQDWMDLGKKVKYDEVYPLFWPKSSGIGCSKTKKCSITVNEKDTHKFLRDADHFLGKNLTFQGVCITVMDGYGNYEFGEALKLSGAGLPDSSKYGDLLGVPRLNGAGFNSFFLIPLLLAFYI